MDDYEEILASKRVIRVLSVAAECGELTITELVRKAGIDHLAGDSIGWTATAPRCQPSGPSHHL